MYTVNSYLAQQLSSQELRTHLDNTEQMISLLGKVSTKTVAQEARLKLYQENQKVLIREFRIRYTH